MHVVIALFRSDKRLMLLRCLGLYHLGRSFISTSISLNQTVACGAMCYCYHVGPWHVLAVITRRPSNERVASVFCRAEVASILSGSLRGVLHCQKIDHARLSSRTSSPRGRRRCRSCSPPSAPTGFKLQLQHSTCSGR